jgi:hypothetical protein
MTRWLRMFHFRSITIWVHKPYVMFTSQPIPGRFWPTSVTTQLRGPQTDLNKIKSQIRENATRIGNAAVSTYLGRLM